MEEQEIWKVWKDTRYKPNGHLYEVSDQGRAKVDGTIYDFENSNQKDWSYYRLGCHDDVHKVVAILFVPNPENKPEVDHINTDTHDNRACNLRWVTHKENMNNPISKTSMKETAKKRKQEGTLKSWKDNINTAGENNPMYGKPRPEKTKKLLAESIKNRKCVNNGIENRCVKDEELQQLLNNGWIYGRLKRS